MAFRTVIPDPIPETSTWRYTATLKDHLGAAIPAAALSTLTLTLYNVNTLAIINSVDDMNILNANRGTVDSNGLLTLVMLPADNPIVNTELVEEVHRMLIEFTYGANAGRHEVDFRVRNLDKVS